jgi:hypothetical protein
VFTLFYDRRHNVTLTRISGVLSSEDLEDHDRVLLNFLAGLFASERKVRGIYDFSQVVALAIPLSKITPRGQRPAIIDGMRVAVAPTNSSGADYASTIARLQRTAGHREPIIVATLEEAYRILEIDGPDFEKVIY